MKYSIEKKLLGTGGAIKKAERMISGQRAFVVNGDTFLEVSLSEMEHFHRRKKALGTLAVTRASEEGRYGTLGVNRAGRISEFAEKGSRSVSKSERDGEPYINGGVYLIEKDLLGRIPPRRVVSLEKEVLPKLVASKRIFGFRTSGYFLDIGVPDDFERAQIELPQRNYDRHSR